METDLESRGDAWAPRTATYFLSTTLEQEAPGIPESGVVAGRQADELQVLSGAVKPLVTFPPPQVLRLP